MRYTAGVRRTAIGFCVAALALAAACKPKPKPEKTGEPATRVTTYEVVQLQAGGKSTLTARLAEETQKARAANLQPFIEFYADWCTYCAALKKSFADPTVQSALTGVYLIEVDIDDWNESLVDAGFDVPEIPLIFELDANGKPTGRVLSDRTYSDYSPAAIASGLREFFDG